MQTGEIFKSCLAAKGHLEQADFQDSYCVTIVSTLCEVDDGEQRTSMLRDSEGSTKVH